MSQDGKLNSPSISEANPVDADAYVPVVRLPVKRKPVMRKRTADEIAKSMSRIMKSCKVKLRTFPVCVNTDDGACDLDLSLKAAASENLEESYSSVSKDVAINNSSLNATAAGVTVSVNATASVNATITDHATSNSIADVNVPSVEAHAEENCLTISGNVEVAAVASEVKVVTANAHVENIEEGSSIVSGNVESFLGGVDSSTPNVVSATAEVPMPDAHVECLEEGSLIGFGNVESFVGGVDNSTPIVVPAAAHVECLEEDSLIVSSNVKSIVSGVDNSSPNAVALDAHVECVEEGSSNVSGNVESFVDGVNKSNPNVVPAATEVPMPDAHVECLEDSLIVSGNVESFVVGVDNSTPNVVCAAAEVPVPDAHVECLVEDSLIVSSNVESFVGVDNSIPNAVSASAEVLVPDARVECLVEDSLIGNVESFSGTVDKYTPNAVSAVAEVPMPDAHVKCVEEGSLIMSVNVESSFGGVDESTPNVVPAAAEVLVPAAEVHVPTAEVCVSNVEGKGTVAEVSNVGFTKANKMGPPVNLTCTVRYKRRARKTVAPFLARKLADRCPGEANGSNDDVDSNIQIDAIAADDNKQVLSVDGPLADEVKGQKTDECVQAAVLAAMNFTTNENNQMDTVVHLEDASEEKESNDDEDVSKKEDGAGSGSDDEDWIDSEFDSDDEDWIDGDFQGELKKSKGKMVPVLKSKRRGKVSASRKLGGSKESKSKMVPVLKSEKRGKVSSRGKVVQKFVGVDKSVVPYGSKKHRGRKRVADQLEFVEKRSKKAKLDIVDTVPEDSAQNFKSTCQLDKFVEVIEHLTATQIRAVEEIGFGGLLKFNIRSVPKNLVQNLIKHFNSTSLVQDIGSERYSVDKNDIYDMFQLPISDLPVVEVCHKGLPKGVHPDDWIRAIWYKKYASKRGVITVKDLYNVIPYLVDDNHMEEFKRVFVMFAVSCFLAPAARNHSDMQIVTSLQNVDTISSYDWCGFVLKRFCATLLRVENSNKFSSINVCLIIPLLAFFYRYPVPRFVDPIELPLHVHWDTEKVKKRCGVYRRGGYTSFVRGTQHFPLTDNGILIGAAPTSKNPGPAKFTHAIAGDEMHNQKTDEFELAAVLAGMSSVSGEKNQMNDVVEDATLQEHENNDDKVVSEKEDGAGSDSGDEDEDEDWNDDDVDSGDEDWINEDWIDDDIQVEKVVAEDLGVSKESRGNKVPVLESKTRGNVSASKKFGGLKESRGNMVPVLRSKKRGKVSASQKLVRLKESKGKLVPDMKSKRRGRVSASKKYDPIAAVDKSAVAYSSKKHNGRKASRKRAADKLELVDKRLKKPKLEMVETVPEDSPHNFKSTCQLDKFVDVMEQLNPAQIRAIEEIGFGGLLKFNIRYVPKYLLRKLIMHFNSTSLVQDIGSERYSVDKNDIYDMFQLPISELPVVEVCHKGKGVVPTDGWIRAIWYKKYASKDGVITVKDLYNVIPYLKDDNQMEEFKRVFVMFAITCFLAPAARNHADMQIVTSLQNVDTISSYDWCGFVLKRYCATLSRVENSDKFSSINVCLVIPLLPFFYRYPVPGIIDPIELPLQKHWDTEKVKKRCAVYRRGGYASFLRGTRNFPLTDNGILIGAPASKNPSSAGPSSSASTQRGCIQLEFSDDTLDDEEIERIAKSPLEAAKMKFKRLVSIASDQYVQALARINEGEQRPSQNLYTSRKITRIDAMVNQVLKEKAKRAHLPSFDLPRFTYNGSHPFDRNV